MGMEIALQKEAIGGGVNVGHPTVTNGDFVVQLCESA